MIIINREIRMARASQQCHTTESCHAVKHLIQRLAIARALLTNPPVLIFDEATSALDPESECVIQKNLKAISRGRTVLIISHRLSIVSHADKIVVIDAGTLSDVGTHKELLSRDGIYKEFWTQQMRGDE